MTSKLLEEQAKKPKDRKNIANSLFIMHKNYNNTMTPKGEEQHDSEPDVLDTIKDGNGGPPSFYEQDVMNYMKKFDNVIEQRAQYKEKMRKFMQFHDPEKNDNVETCALDNTNNITSFIPSKRKGDQTRNVPLKMNKPTESTIVQSNTTFLKKRGSMQERPRSRGSTRANTVMDFDWYGNFNSVSYLVLLITELLFR